MTTDFLLDFQCPQCGAPVELHESDRLFRCPYCRVKLLISTGDGACYHIPPVHSPPNIECLYVPYWRFRGTEYTIQSAQVECGLVDATVRAIDSEMFPEALGIRTQTQKLRFVDPQTAGRFLPPTLDRPRFLDILEKKLDGTRRLGRIFNRPAKELSSIEKVYSGTDITAQTADRFTAGLTRHASGKQPAQPGPEHVYIGETICLIYSPYYADGNRFYDAITGKPLTTSPTAAELARAGTPGAWRPKFIPSLCPQCGWDLAGRHDSIVLGCTNCRTPWSVSGGNLEPTVFTVMATDEKPDLFIPFWCYEIECGGIKLESYADFIRISRFQRPIVPDMERQPMRFWTPAFKAAPTRHLLYGQQMTVRQNKTSRHDTLPAAGCYPVTLPCSEGQQSLPVLLRTLFRRNGKVVENFINDTIRPRSATLVYVPFVRRNFEYIQPDLNFSIHGNALKRGRTL